MTQKYYRIIDCILEITYETQHDLIALQDFEESKATLRPDLRVTLQNGGGAFGEYYGIACCRTSERWPNIFISQRYPKIRMAADAACENALVGGYTGGYQEGVMEVIMTFFYSYLARRGGLLLHASCIDHQGNSLIFLGKSGIGKTTQAKLWNKYQGAEILNGDKVFLTGGTKRRLLAWGSPWRGSSPYGVNRCAPLKAVVALQQGECNTIRELTSLEKLQYLSPHIFYPFWDDQCMANGMDTMDKLGRLPVYLLRCRPDEEAVRLTLDTVFG